MLRRGQKQLPLKSAGGRQEKGEEPERLPGGGEGKANERAAERVRKEESVAHAGREGLGLECREGGWKERAEKKNRGRGALKITPSASGVWGSSLLALHPQPSAPTM